MMIYLAGLVMAHSFSVTSFPKGGAPPLPTIGSAAVYDSINNCIIAARHKCINFPSKYF